MACKTSITQLCVFISVSLSVIQSMVRVRDSPHIIWCESLAFPTPIGYNAITYLMRTEGPGCMYAGSLMNPHFHDWNNGLKSSGHLTIAESRIAAAVEERAQDITLYTLRDVERPGRSRYNG